MKKINLKGVTVETWTRTIVLIIALVSQFLVILGKTTKTIDMEQWTVYVSYVTTAIASVWAWWKNNSFTDKAQAADKLLKGDSDNVKNQ